MLEIKNLNISYNNKAVVKDVNFSLTEGETLCIVGESGSGKTTLLKTIMNLLPESAKVDKGEIFYKDKILTRVCPTEISIVFQDTRAMLNPVRKIGVQFTQYIRKHKTLNKSQAYDLAVKTLKQLGLEEKVMNSYSFQLSGGMMQRVGLAFSLSLAPKLLLLDEPTSALDVTTQAQVIDMIVRLKEEFNVTILMITHNIPLAIFMANRVAVMQNGEILEISSAEEILTNPRSQYTKSLIANIPRLKVS